MKITGKLDEPDITLWDRVFLKYVSCTLGGKHPKKKKFITAKINEMDSKWST